jgi:hypothetical protein
VVDNLEHSNTYQKPEIMSGLHSGQDLGDLNHEEVTLALTTISAFSGCH